MPNCKSDLGTLSRSFAGNCRICQGLDAQDSGSTVGILAGVDDMTNSAGNSNAWNYGVGFRNRCTSQDIDNAFISLERTAFGAMVAGNSNDDTQFYSPQRPKADSSWYVSHCYRSRSMGI